MSNPLSSPQSVRLHAHKKLGYEEKFTFTYFTCIVNSFCVSVYVLEGWRSSERTNFVMSARLFLTAQMCLNFTSTPKFNGFFRFLEALCELDGFPIRTCITMCLSFHPATLLVKKKLSLSEVCIMLDQKSSRTFTWSRTQLFLAGFSNHLPPITETRFLLYITLKSSGYCRKQTVNLVTFVHVNAPFTCMFGCNFLFFLTVALKSVKYTHKNMM